MKDRKAGPLAQAVLGGGYSVSNIADGTWHHVVITWDGNTDSPSTGITIYVDGVAQSYIDQSNGTFVAVRDTTQDVLIGRQGNLNFRDFDGYIALPGILSRALSPTDVQNNYNQEKHLFEP